MSNDTPPSLLELFRSLAEEHFEIEPGLVRVAVFSHEGDPELRLVEVNRETIATGSVEPFAFAADKQCPVPVFIADITPEEWERLDRGELPLPAGWPARPADVIERQAS